MSFVQTHDIFIRQFVRHRPDVCQHGSHPSSPPKSHDIVARPCWKCGTHTHHRHLNTDRLLENRPGAQALPCRRAACFGWLVTLVHVPLMLVRVFDSAPKVDHGSFLHFVLGLHVLDFTSWTSRRRVSTWTESPDCCPYCTHLVTS